MRNVLLLTPLVLILACSPKVHTETVHQLELEKKYPKSSYLVATSVEEKVFEPEVLFRKDYAIGKEKTTYVNKTLLTLSNEKEQKIFLPYVKASHNKAFRYEEPKTTRQLAQGKSTSKMHFVEIDKNLIYPLQHLRQLPNEFYVPQEELITDKPVEKRVVEQKREVATNASQSPAFFVLIGDVYLGLNDDMTLANVNYVRKNLEYVRVDLIDIDEELRFSQISKTKKTALSEKNYSIIYLGKKGNTLLFRKVYLNTDKVSETREVVLSSPQINVFGHNILVQTATREALHCVIKN